MEDTLNYQAGVDVFTALEEAKDKLTEQEMHSLRYFANFFVLGGFDDPYRISCCWQLCRELQKDRPDIADKELISVYRLISKGKNKFFKRENINEPLKYEFKKEDFDEANLDDVEKDLLYYLLNGEHRKQTAQLNALKAIKDSGSETISIPDYPLLETLLNAYAQKKTFKDWLGLLTIEQLNYLHTNCDPNRDQTHAEMFALATHLFGIVNDLYTYELSDKNCSEIHDYLIFLKVGSCHEKLRRAEFLDHEYSKAWSSIEDPFAEILTKKAMCLFNLAAQDQVVLKEFKSLDKCCQKLLKLAGSHSLKHFIDNKIGAVDPEFNNALLGAFEEAFNFVD